MGVKEPSQVSLDRWRQQAKVGNRPRGLAANRHPVTHTQSVPTESAATTGLQGVRGVATAATPPARDSGVGQAAAELDRTEKDPPLSSERLQEAALVERRHPKGPRRGRSELQGQDPAPPPPQAEGPWGQRAGLQPPRGPARVEAPQAWRCAVQAEPRHQRGWTGWDLGTLLAPHGGVSKEPGLPPRGVRRDFPGDPTSTVESRNLPTQTGGHRRCHRRSSACRPARAAACQLRSLGPGHLSAPYWPGCREPVEVPDKRTSSGKSPAKDRGALRFRGLRVTAVQALPSPKRETKSPLQHLETDLFQTNVPRSDSLEQEGGLPGAGPMDAQRQGPWSSGPGPAARAPLLQAAQDGVPAASPPSPACPVPRPQPSLGWDWGLGDMPICPS
ncbi:synapsin-1-like [Marmota monax]|uniref:synapsin-1-like n=1 Tax=Marmota monax TaxID=9995 RepID=UPI0026EFD9DA|nr:synapsin-1-like [Marmota monax]